MRTGNAQYFRCNRLRCPLARLSGLQCFNMSHNGHGINLYGVVMILMGNLHAGGQFNLGHLSLLHRYTWGGGGGGGSQFHPCIVYADFVSEQCLMIRLNNIY